MNDNAKVLKYLKTGESLTVQQAHNIGLCANLRSRISQIEDQGHIIDRKLIREAYSGCNRLVRSYRLVRK